MAIDINIPSQVKNYANLAGFPATGTLKTIFIAEDTNKTYRWTGSAYVEISASQATAWGAITGTLSNQTDLQNALNAKQDTLVSATNIKTINGTTLLGSGDLVVGGGGVTIGTTAITSGTVGRVLFEGTGNVVQESAQLSWNNSTNALLVTTGKTFSGYNSGGSASDALKLELTGGGAVLGIQNSNASGFSGVEYLNNSGSPRVFTGFNNSNGQEFRFNNFASGGYIDFLISTTSAFRIFNTRNIGINTTTDAGFRLDVNGTARVSGPSTYSMVYDSNGILNLNGTYARLDLFNQSGSLRARLNCDGPNGTLTLYQNAAGYIFLNGAQSGNNSYISTALSIGNQSAANASSILEVSSTTKGFLPPRMTTTQKNAIASPATGLMVYDNVLNRPCFYDGATWITL